MARRPWSRRFTDIRDVHEWPGVNFSFLGFLFIVQIFIHILIVIFQFWRRIIHTHQRRDMQNGV